jgi:thiol peroxidase
LKGNPVPIEGTELKPGDAAPDFRLQGADLADVSLASSAGKTRIVCSVPSLDTAVCSMESKKFNDQAGDMPGVEVVIVSTDLPFAMKRWCGAENANNIKVASDHRDVSFGKSYGVLIAGGPLSRCLARAVFVIGPDDKIKHVEYVPEIATEPNYDAILAAAK